MPDPRPDTDTALADASLVERAGAFLTELEQGLTAVEGWLATTDRTALPVPALPSVPQGAALTADMAPRAHGVAVRLQDVLHALTVLRDQVAGELSTSGDRRTAARSYLVHEPKHSG